MNATHEHQGKTLSVTDTARTHLPYPINPVLDRTLSYHANKLTSSGLGHVIKAQDMPSAEAREAMERRVVAIQHWLGSSDEAWILKHVTALLAVRPSQFDDKDDKKAAMLIYIHTLRTLPRFALEKVFADAHAGRIGNPPWAPTPAELCQAGERLTDPLIREKAKITRVLTARVDAGRSSPDRRKELADLARTSIQTGAIEAAKVEAQRMRVKPRVETIETPAQFAARVASPMTLSDAARRTMGLAAAPVADPGWDTDDLAQAAE